MKISVIKIFLRFRHEAVPRSLKQLEFVMTPFTKKMFSFFHLKAVEERSCVGRQKEKVVDEKEERTRENIVNPFLDNLCGDVKSVFHAVQLGWLMGSLLFRADINLERKIPQ